MNDATTPSAIERAAALRDMLVRAIGSNGESVDAVESIIAATIRAAERACRPVSMTTKLRATELLKSILGRAEWDHARREDAELLIAEAIHDAETIARGQEATS